MGMKLNPDLKIVKSINNIVKLNDGYCPSYPGEHGNPNFKCPCQRMLDKEECHCKLYIKKE